MIRAVGMAFFITWFLVAAGPAEVVLSSYFGGAGDDRLTGAAVASDGTIIVAGTMPAAKLTPSERVPAGKGSGDGILLRLTADGERVLSVRRFVGTISDLDADAEDNVYVTGGFGSVKLSLATGEQFWASTVGGEGARIAAGPGGGAVVLSGGAVTVLDPQGKSLRSWDVGASHVNDIACDVRHGLVFVTGFHNRRGTPPGQKNYPVQVAFVYAYDSQGKKVWTAYDWEGQEVADVHLMADTRGYRLAMGADGKLYVAGESAGGNTMWSRRSHDLGTELPLAKGDKYQVPYNTRANHITFVGRLDPKTGETEAGTMLVARLSDGRGNTIRPRALAADAGGRVHVGGASASYPPVSPDAFGGSFEGGGAFYCIFDRNFRRLYAAKLCSGSTAAIALGKKAVVVVGDGKENLTTVKPFQAKAAGGESDGWVVVFAEKP
jgi:hypothetical protein